MTSGEHLTLEEKDAVLRMASLKNPDGSWALTYQDIADRLRLHPITVSRIVRSAAVKWGKLHRWHPPGSDP